MSEIGVRLADQSLGVWDWGERVRLFYSDRFPLPLPEKHRFPMSKYRLLRERVAADRHPQRTWSLAEPPAVSDVQILRVHHAGYLRQVCNGTLDAAAQRLIGFPWSPQLVERSRRSSGATLAACRAARQDGFAANLAGGTHHAFPDHGEGFCVFNDAVIAARALQVEDGLQRIAVIDCDVHQGNGTAVAARDHPQVFTFSVHAARNYPRIKQTSDLDIALPDHTGDEPYLDAVRTGLQRVLEFRPEMAIYLAGADPFSGDRLGRLEVSPTGLARRDSLVLSALRDAAIPCAIAMAGGYAPDVRQTVDIHFRTVCTAAELLAENSNSPARDAD